MMKKKNESSYSRIHQHTQDDSTFAIIGSQDLDTKKDRYNELLTNLRKVSNKHKGKGIGFNRVNGTYSYVDDKGKDDRIGYEKSLIIYNITKEEALALAKSINQESIVWKDSNFLGLIFLDDLSTVRFNNVKGKNMNFSGAATPDDDGNIFGTKLAKDKDTTYPFGFRFEGKITYPKGLRSKYLGEVTEHFVFS